MKILFLLLAVSAHAAPLIGSQDLQQNIVVKGTVTIQGNAFSVVGSTFVLVGGNVGVGTASPNLGSHNAAETISSLVSTGRSGLELQGNSANGFAVVQFYNNGSLAGAVEGRGSNGNASTNVNITSTGSIGLGTSAGTQIFRCSGGSAADSGALLYGNSGVAQTACTVGGGTLTGTGVFLP